MAPFSKQPLTPGILIVSPALQPNSTKSKQLQLTLQVSTSIIDSPPSQAQKCNTYRALYNDEKEQPHESQSPRQKKITLKLQINFLHLDVRFLVTCII